MPFLVKPAPDPPASSVKGLRCAPRTPHPGAIDSADGQVAFTARFSPALTSLKLIGVNHRSRNKNLRGELRLAADTKGMVVHSSRATPMFKQGLASFA